MPPEIVTLDDGSVLLANVATAPPVRTAPEGVLGGGDLVQFVVEAVAGGITFEALKAIATRLGPREAEAARTADVVRDEVTNYILRSGYVAVVIDELRQVGTHGWTVKGRADEVAFHALADPSGSVIHVRFE